MISEEFYGKIKINNLTIGDVVHLKYLDADNVMECVSIVNEVYNDRQSASFSDIITITDEELDPGWNASDSEIEIIKILFNHNPTPVIDVLTKLYPEFML